MRRAIVSATNPILTGHTPSPTNSGERLVTATQKTGLALDLLKGESVASPRHFQRPCEFATRAPWRGLNQQPGASVSPAAVLAPQNFVATKVGVSSDGQPEAADAAARSRGNQVSRAHGVRRDSGTACARPVKHAREYPPVLSSDFYQGLIFALILVAPFWVLVGCAIRRWA